MMGEHDRIARYFAPLTERESGAFHLTDDAAVLAPPAGKQLVITTDSVIENIHVLGDATPQQFAQKLVRRNLSDLAAMGATPWRYTLNLHTPHGLSDHWFAMFAAALAEEQTLFDMVLAGGDSTSGGTVIHTTMTCLGLIAGNSLRRSGACVGDDLYVSGSIGDAALALTLLQQKLEAPASLLARYHCPQPRLALGQLLQGFATAAIDISDGLLADISQLCNTSGVGAQIERDMIPRSPMLQQFLQQNEIIWEYILGGGDDYELAFTAAPAQREAIQAIAGKLELPLVRIGGITDGAIELIGADGAALPLPQSGWEHR